MDRTKDRQLTPKTVLCYSHFMTGPGVWAPAMVRAKLNWKANWSPTSGCDQRGRAEMNKMDVRKE